MWPPSTPSPSWAVVGPRILDADGSVYPSVRRFPSMTDAAGHALLALFKPDNRFSRRYRDRRRRRRPAGPGRLGVGRLLPGAAPRPSRSWAASTSRYFMFAEEMDLCWRAHRAGWGVGFEPAAVVTHVEGVSRRRHPYRMLLAHHRSALRFANRTTQGWRRLALPLAALVLGVRLVMAMADEALRH